MFQTKNDLTPDLRRTMVALLNANLADAIDLQLECKQAHWNVKGPNFIALHKFFDELHDAVEGMVDDIAERAVALGGTADGRVGHVAENTRLANYPKTKEVTTHLEALATAFSAFGKNARAAIDEADEAGDAGTADLFTQVSRECDKQLWMIEAHLQG